MCDIASVAHAADMRDRGCPKRSEPSWRRRRRRPSRPRVAVPRSTRTLAEGTTDEQSRPASRKSTSGRTSPTRFAYRFRCVVPIWHQEVSSKKKKDGNGLVYSRFDFSDAREKRSVKPEQKTSIKQLLQKVHSALANEFNYLAHRPSWRLRSWMSSRRRMATRPRRS